MIKNRRAFIVGLKSSTLSKKEIIFLKKYRPWGIILFSRNISSIEQSKKLTDKIKKIFKDKKYPILIDQEGGRVRGLSKIISLDNLPR
jgi:Beta-glucosidase-related glycosidases